MFLKTFRTDFQIFAWRVLLVTVQPEFDNDRILDRSYIGCSTLYDFCTTIRFDFSSKPATFPTIFGRGHGGSGFEKTFIFHVRMLSMDPLHSQKITVSKFGLWFYSLGNDRNLKIVIHEKLCIADEQS